MVFLNKKLKTVQSLNKVFGLGLFKSNYICNRLGLKTNLNLNNLNELSFKRLIYYLNNNYNLDNYLNNKSKANIKFKINLGTYEGNRHRLGYPVCIWMKLLILSIKKKMVWKEISIYPNYLYCKSDLFFPSFIKNSIYKKYYLVFDITQHWLISNCDFNVREFLFSFLKKK